MSTYSKNLRKGFLVQKGFCPTFDWLLFNKTHCVESDLDSVWLKIMFDKWISQHDSYIAVQKYN